MYFLENILSALDAIYSNKLRSGLTMLGVIIGVASVVLMVAIGQGAQQDVTSRLHPVGWYFRRNDCVHVVSPMA